MDKLIIFYLFLILTTTLGFSQKKMYIWCPEELTPVPRIGFLENEEIYLQIIDSRLFSPKSKIECTSDELVENLKNFLFQVYPSVSFVNIKDYQKLTPENINIRIEILTYNATFYTGMWFATTKYLITISDSRKNPDMLQKKEIEVTTKLFNAAGHRTAKKNLGRSYMDANSQMLSFINETLLE